MTLSTDQAVVIGNTVTVLHKQQIEIRSGVGNVLWKSQICDGDSMFPGNVWDDSLRELREWRKREETITGSASKIRRFVASWTDSTVRHDESQKVLDPWVVDGCTAEEDR